MPSFRGDAKHRTRNLEIPGLVLTHHPGMTKSGINSFRTAMTALVSWLFENRIGRVAVAGLVNRSSP
jgi:hypothetical protein